MSAKFVILDIETTGLNPQQGAIIEIGALKLSEAAIVGEYQALLRPKIKVEPGAFSAHGISDEHLVAHGREPASVLTEFFLWVEDCPLVAHNGLGFDFPFLAEECRRYSVNHPPSRLLDTLPLARQLLNTPDGSFSLKALCDAYQITNERAHRALADAKAATEVFKKVLQLCPDPEDLWRRCFQCELNRLLEPPKGFEWVEEAMKKGMPLQITYETEGRPPARERWIHPLNFSVGITGRPSLRALCLEENIEKSFRLDRMGRPQSSNDSTPK